MEALSVNWTDKMPAFGAEASILINDRWKADLGGMFQFSYNPGYLGVPGTAENDYNYSAGDLPAYRAVPADQQVAYVLYLAGSYCFKIPAIPAMRPYCGLRFSFAYANDQKKYDELSSMGISSAETFSRWASPASAVWITSWPPTSLSARRWTWRVMCTASRSTDRRTVLPPSPGTRTIWEPSGHRVSRLASCFSLDEA